jgi:hypothetical protein
VIDFAFIFESWKRFILFTKKILYDKHSGEIDFHIFHFILHMSRKFYKIVLHNVGNFYSKMSQNSHENPPIFDFLKFLAKNNTFY